MPFEIGDAAVGVSRKQPISLEQRLNATEAFNNPQWKYGKIINGVQKLAGLADIHAKLGYQCYKNASTEFSLYGSLVIPTGYKPTAEFVFEPLVGNGQHWALGAGLSLNSDFFDHNDLHAQFSSNFDFLYLLSNVQKRSFDLKNNGEWSRYLLVSDRSMREPLKLSDTLQPGINFFTQNVTVAPMCEFSWLNAISFSYKKVAFEVGHSIWIKNRETLTLKDAFPQNIALVATHFGIRVDNLVFDEAQSFSQATISKSITDFAQADPVNVFLNNNDLDLDSGTSPFRLSNKLHLMVGMNTSWKEKPLHISACTSYEIAHANSSLDAWMICFKIGTSI